MNKRHLNCFNYDSAVHFQFEGIEINKIILFFSVKTKNTQYLSLKTVQWFTICGTSLSSGLTIC